MKKLFTDNPQEIEVYSHANELILIKGDVITYYDMTKDEEVHEFSNDMFHYNYSQAIVYSILDDAKSPSKKNVRIKVEFPETQTFESLDEASKKLNVSEYYLNKFLINPESTFFNIKITKL